jgi:ankyrin repeat protein
MQYFVENMDRETLRKKFIVACAEGNLILAKELTKTYNLETGDARSEDNAALRFACLNGHISTAQWLVETFKLTTDDARSDDNSALRWACASGFASTARWLIETFSLTSGDVRSANNAALRWACQKDHASTVQWLLDTFYTKEDALEMSKPKYISKKMKEFLENYQPIGAFTKSAQM